MPARSATSSLPPAELVGAIYQAGIEPSRWAEVVGQIVTWVGGLGGGITIRTTWPQLTSRQIWAGVDPDFERAYADEHFHHDPWLARIGAVVPGTTVLAQELIADLELLETPFFEALCRPFGVRDWQASVLLRSAREVVAFVMFRAEGAKFDLGTKRRLEALTPHLTRAVRVALDLDDKYRCHSVINAATLARRLGVVRVDAALHVLAEPEGASAWLEVDGGPLRVVGRRIVAIEPEDDVVLRSAVAAAIAGTATTVVLGRRSGDLVSVLVVPAPDGSPLVLERSAHVLFSPPVDATRASALRDAFALTPAEARVAVKVGRGQPLRTIASDLGVSYHTVRAHLRQCFVKTGARRQSALAALVHGAA